MIKLREYQLECLDTMASEKARGIVKQLVQLPTGTGKTFIAAELVKRTDGKSLILAHRDELIRQAHDKLSMVCPELSMGIVKAQENDLSGQVTIASVQTVARPKRLSELKAMDFRTIVTDEAHHSVAPTYQTVFEGVWNRDDRNQIHLGMTATPNRMDNAGLGKCYQKIVYKKSIQEMIAAGWLCDLRCISIKTNVSLRSVKTARGRTGEKDFSTTDLANVVNTRNRNDLIVESYLKHAKDRLALCFTVNVKHAVDLANVFNANGVDAMAISGETPTEERREILRRFHDKEISVLCNCMLLTEGYDEAAIDCIILARPTQSQSLYIQMIGRGTRIYPEKKDCLILDLADLSGKHNIIQLGELLGLDEEFSDGKKSFKEAIASKPTGDTQDELTVSGVGITASSVNLFAVGSSDNFWIDLYDGTYILVLAQMGYIKIVPFSGHDGKYAVYYQPSIFDKDERDFFAGKRPLLFDYARGFGDSKADEVCGTGIAKRAGRWNNDPMSYKQRNLLQGKGVLHPGDATKRECIILMSCFNHSRNKQEAIKKHYDKMMVLRED